MAQSLSWLLNVIQTESNTYIDFNSYDSGDCGKFDKFAQAVFRIDG
jgi:hypothetical protein